MCLLEILTLDHGFIVFYTKFDNMPVVVDARIAENDRCVHVIRIEV